MFFPVPENVIPLYEEVCCCEIIFFGFDAEKSPATVKLPVTSIFTVLSLVPI